MTVFNEDFYIWEIVIVPVFQSRKANTKRTTVLFTKEYPQHTHMKSKGDNGALTNLSV